jgi:hypothetical protein
LSAHVQVPLPNNPLLKHGVIYQVEQVSGEWLHVSSTTTTTMTNTSIGAGTANSDKSKKKQESVRYDCGLVHQSLVSTPGDWSSCYQLVRQPLDVDLSSPSGVTSSSATAATSTSTAASSSSSKKSSETVILEEKFVKIDHVIFAENLSACQPSFHPCVLKSNHPHNLGKEPDLQMLIDDLTSNRATLGHLYQLLTYLKRVLSALSPSTSGGGGASSLSSIGGGGPSLEDSIANEDPELTSWRKNAVSLGESALCMFFMNWEANNRMKEHAYYAKLLKLPISMDQSSAYSSGGIDVGDKKDARNDSDLVSFIVYLFIFNMKYMYFLYFTIVYFYSALLIPCSKLSIFFSSFFLKYFFIVISPTYIYIRWSML